MTQQTRRAPQDPRRTGQDEDAQHGHQAPGQGCPAGSSSAPALAQGWCALSALHGRIESHIERALQARHDLSVREFSVLNVLNEQHDGPGGHLRMHQVADSVVLSQSATTRLVTRLEERRLLSRYLCPDDRRGIYTNVTDEGRQLLEEARPTHDAALREALQDAAKRPELAPLVTAVETLAAPA
ncbi:transcriptional regulator [Streptomyces chrestomyceticus JCM 4735]|uniref:Transcriptional regulator n=1 Tax=Streptomyces chrestomyceticus JCM 4735 TaxID=1306181 RepID=A0A7U9Q1F1_9ACTN|nr:MarR family transcriptional regulator [Streptomyces chrestomyceticus]GCD36309.1 transcriptional regulator [Streptomyces chrestomyceticus JCM 4735]